MTMIFGRGTCAASHHFRLHQLLLALIVVVGCIFRHAVSASDVHEHEASFVIGGYLPDYRAYIDINATAIHLTDLMLFSLTPESVASYNADADAESGGCCLSSDHYDKVRKAIAYKKEHHHHQQNEHEHEHGEKSIRLWLTVGGGGRSNGFGDIVTGNSEVQRQFIKKLVQLCRDKEFDGIDFDFEGIQSLEQWKGYQKFLARASTYIYRHGLHLSVALHPGQYLSKEVCASVDRVHVMTYDMTRSISGDERPNHHASLDSVHEAITKFIQNGCLPSKLIMGIPAYGRHEENMGLVKTYSEVVDEVMGGATNDEAKEVMEAIQSLKTWKGYQIDSPDDVRAKVKYAIQNGLGGIFFWELGQDKHLAGVADGGILLGAAASYAAELGIGKDGSSSNREEL